MLTLIDRALEGLHLMTLECLCNVHRDFGNRCYGPVLPTILQSPSDSLQPSYQRVPSIKAGIEDLQSVKVTSFSSTEERDGLRATKNEIVNDEHSADLQVLGAAALSLDEAPEAIKAFESRTLLRKEIFDKIGCQPRDPIEEAVCKDDHSAFASLLNKKNNFWRSKLRKVHSLGTRNSAAFRLIFRRDRYGAKTLASNFNINEAPFGYTVSLTPLTFAIGARQIDMVEFLTANAARPSQPDSWSTLAGQLMNRSWLKKTMSEAEKEHVPNRMIEILRILLKHGWDTNTPFEASSETVLHQAVTFWTGSYKWDLNLCAALTSFLANEVQILSKRTHKARPLRHGFGFLPLRPPAGS